MIILFLLLANAVLIASLRDERNKLKRLPKETMADILRHRGHFDK